MFLIEIIDRLDRRRKRWCWADLVLWAVFRKPWRDLWDCRHTTPETRCGYCGKHTPEPDEDGP